MLVPEPVGLLFEVAWTGYDGGVGIVGFDVEYKQDGQAWTGWLTNTLDTEAMFVAESGQSYTFRVTATDRVGNVGQDEAAGDIKRMGGSLSCEEGKVRKSIDGRKFYVGVNKTRPYKTIGQRLASLTLIRLGEASTIRPIGYSPVGLVDASPLRSMLVSAKNG
mgnify:CR=1 FL=1